MILPVTCDTLGELDMGTARAIIDAAIRDAVNDLEDRGHQDGKPRKVEIVLTFDLVDNGNNVAASLEAMAKAPRRKTNSTIGVLRRDGRDNKVLFQQFSPENPAQTTIDEYERPAPE